jgi:hypothetical protein
MIKEIKLKELLKDFIMMLSKSYILLKRRKKKWKRAKKKWKSKSN